MEGRTLLYIVCIIVVCTVLSLYEFYGEYMFLCLNSTACATVHNSSFFIAAATQLLNALTSDITTIIQGMPMITPLP